MAGLREGLDAHIYHAIELEVKRLDRLEKEQRLMHELRHALQEALQSNDPIALEKSVHHASSLHKEDFKDGMPKALEEVLQQARDALHARKHSMVVHAQAAARGNVEENLSWSGKLRGEFGPRNGAAPVGR